ncbi:MAG: hypothetical protein C5B53_12325 [Candidatus Melainabacteria bacterium]|nr:MAG: hypothetical protein C5B53_12325 [Candidatus Melainabacteria bacterium]
MTDPVRQYFCYPSNQIASFEPGSSVASDPGYFRFGPALVCYGKTSAGYRSKIHDQRLYDTADDIAIQHDTIRLPFDLREVVTNLTHERYLESSTGEPGKLLRQLYYALRPMLPTPLRSPLQRLYLTNKAKCSFPAWPVDTTVDELMTKLLLLGMKTAGLDSLPFIWFWPDGASACSIMTHDVEAEGGKQFCSALMDIDEQFGVPASFQIVPEQRYAVTLEFIDSIRCRSFEINVQDLNHDGRLFWDYERFKHRVQRINDYGRQFKALGFRSGILYRRQEWFDLLDFQYDMSVPNVGHFDPQRGGCCTVMPYFIGKILELPVTTSQDHTVFHYLKRYSLDLWRSQIESIIGKHGLISFIFHPDYLRERRAMASYKELLVELQRLRSTKNLWITQPSDVNKWWRNRAEMRLALRNGKWTIEGRDKERACVAFAALEDDKIVYTVPSRAAGLVPA